MSDPELLYDFEGKLEDAFASLLSVVPVEVSQGSVSHEAPCVSVMYTHSGQSDHARPFPDGKWRNDDFSGSLQVDIVTNRKVPDLNISHRKLRSLVRKILAAEHIDGRETISALNGAVEDLDIYYFKEVPSQKLVAPDNSEDVTSLRFELRFSFLFPNP